ncbi:hypothetical protein HPB51_003081 [Rhipicephalus microplus]|uniref:Uncharacterized protein n=1 Tax=Rhipicephalus microplus TaxID=6941 RepID=A0A9J6EEZ4_RHIMP|nr:hypothetical protein HPB51_003081 [Rhipicephalus microplus]
MYDPTVNILEQPWSPFVEVPWVLPVLRNFSEWRESFKKVRGRVHAASTLADVEFIADFPGNCERRVTTFTGYMAAMLASLSASIEQWLVCSAAYPKVEGLYPGHGGRILMEAKW